MEASEHHEHEDHPQAIERKSQISKIDVTLLVILWVITAWGIVAERLASDENIYMSESAKFYISISIPIGTSAAALMKSIQVGMEIKSDHVAEREHREAINTINADTVIIEQPQTSHCSCRHSTEEDSHRPDNDELKMVPDMNDVMPRRPMRNLLKNIDERRCRSMPTLQRPALASLSYIDNSFEESVDYSSQSDRA